MPLLAGRRERVPREGCRQLADRSSVVGRGAARTRPVGHAHKDHGEAEQREGHVEGLGAAAFSTDA